MSKFISNKTTKVDLGDGEYVEIRKELPYEDMMQMSDIETDKSKITDLLEKCMVSWNLKDEDGNDVPLNRDNIRKLHFQYLEPIISTITEAMKEVTDNAKKKSKKQSE